MQIIGLGGDILKNARLSPHRLGLLQTLRETTPIFVRLDLARGEMNLVGFRPSWNIRFTLGLSRELEGTISSTPCPLDAGLKEIHARPLPQRPLPIALSFMQLSSRSQSRMPIGPASQNSGLQVGAAVKRTPCRGRIGA
jgi:hypothetical protein